MSGCVVVLGWGLLGVFFLFVFFLSFFFFPSIETKPQAARLLMEFSVCFFQDL